MKPGKISWVLIFIGILFLLTGIVLGQLIYSKGLETNGIFSMEKVVVSVKNQLDKQGINGFSTDDIKKLPKQLKTKDLTYISQSGLISTAVSRSGSNSGYAVKITGTNYLYPMFNKLLFKSGSFITLNNENEGAYVAVVEESVAWNLYKTTNAVGKTILVYNVPFKIVGVFKKENSIIERLTNSGIADIFIPAGKMLELDTTAKIKSFQVRTTDVSTLDLNTTFVSEAIQQIGKSPANYKIEDYNLKKAALMQKPKFIVFIMGVISIFILLVYLKNSIAAIVRIFKQRNSGDYFTNVLHDNLLTMGVFFIKFILVIGGCVLIWSGIKFKFYIPPSYIPDELINVSYYIALIKNNIQAAVSSLGFVAPNTELVTNTVQTVLNWIFYVSLLPGFVLLYIGFVQLKTFNLDMSKVILYFGLFFICSLGLMAAASYLSGLAFSIDIKNLLVFWSFLAILAIKVQKPDEV